MASEKLRGLHTVFKEDVDLLSDTFGWFLVCLKLFANLHEVRQKLFGLFNRLERFLPLFGPSAFQLGQAGFEVLKETRQLVAGSGLYEGLERRVEGL